jgi:radical SAM superfamily enzyme YgiQ (UPF0313 family)
MNQIIKLHKLDRKSIQRKEKKSLVKVGLVQINNNYSGQSYLPYSIGLLQSYVQANATNPLRYEFLIPVHLRMRVDEALSKLEGADIVGFSAYVWNIRLSLEIARRIKEANPSTLIVFGGPQVPNNAEIFLRKNSFIDVVIHGEGEIGFLAVLEQLEEQNWIKVPSASFINIDGNYQSNSAAPRMVDHGEELSPYLKNVFVPLIKANPHEHWLAIWETNRGCPFACTYCDWGSSIQSKVNKFEINRLYKEVSWFAENKIEFVFCADANFGMLERDYDIAACVAESKRNFGYPRTISVQNTKNATEKSYKVQKLLADSKLNMSITLSFQSTDEQTLKNIKRDNISLKSFKELQRRFTNDKIPTYTDIIIGLPGESYNSYANGVSSIIEGGQHNRIFFMNLSILPNAEMGDPEYQKRFGLITVENEVVYIRGSINQIEDEFIEMQELVIGNNDLPKEDWVRARSFAWICNLLHFNKLLQIPLIILNKVALCSYRELIELFSEPSLPGFPILNEIACFFTAKAIAIQNGDHEFCPSAEWLGVYWPVDEYFFIKLSKEGKVDQFYKEAKKRIEIYLEEKEILIPSNLLNEAFELNHFLLKQPFIDSNLKINSSFNIHEFYLGVLNGAEIALEEVNRTYEIDRKTHSWSSWDTWYREVVWYCSKSGEYTYPILNSGISNDYHKLKLAGHH